MNKGSNALPTTGDLRNPIELVRSNRTPAGDADFQQTLTPYAQPWSCRRLSKRTFIGGKDTDSDATHIFWIRYDGSFSVEAKDYVRDGNELFAIAKVEPKGVRDEWLKLSVIYHKDLTGSEVPGEGGVITLNPGTPSEPEEETPEGKTGNDFFFN